MNSFVRTLAVMMVGLGGLSAGPAAAGFVTETISATVAQQATDFTRSVVLPTFNPGLGTLEGVVVSLGDGGTFQGSVINNATSSESFSVTEDVRLGLSFGNIGIASNDLIAEQRYSGLGPSSSDSFGAYHPTGSAGPVTYTSGSLFDAFDAPSSEVTLTLWTMTSTTISGGGGNLTSAIGTEAGATVTVQYLYEPMVAVPEPASLALCGIAGVLGLVVARVRRSRSA